MPNFISQRLAAIRGFDPEEPYWTKLFEALESDLKRYVKMPESELALTALIDPTTIDAILTAAWFSATYDQSYDEQDRQVDWLAEEDSFISSEEMWDEYDRRGLRKTG